MTETLAKRQIESSEHQQPGVTVWFTGLKSVSKVVAKLQELGYLDLPA